ncbi:hypothetical protein BJ170DRAFT_608478 [Xylariales sp. AK1849]|nr:hypothetical protein BJ170DRAFT_608478 [Xylariales sp. AK1849]
MADDEKTKAEKLAAAKKRVEAMKNKKAKKTGGAPKKEKDESKPEASTSAVEEAEPTEPFPPNENTEGEPDAAEEVPEKPTSPVQTSYQQSKLRSASFRAGSVSASGPLSPTGFPLSPEAETAADIYRKQVARIEDLEKENKRLAKEATDSEKRWQKAEEELADLRESDGKAGGGSDGQVEKLQAELAALQRQNAQLQSAAVSRRGHGHSPSVSMSSPPDAALQAQLASKTATIETMELELSRLRAQAARQATAGGTDKEQITALEDKLARAEQAAAKSTRELGDLKRNLERTTEKAIKEGSSRTSAETKVRTLEQDTATLKTENLDLQKKHDALDKKIAALGNLHKENDSRAQTLRREKDSVEKELLDLKNRLERVEADNTRLRKKDAAEGGGDDDGVEELENEERLRLEKKVRDLEAEVYDLRRGIWHQRRREMEPGSAGGETTSPSGGFTNIDLGPLSPNGALRKASQQKGLGDFFASGFNALTGAGATARGEDEGLLEDDDEVEFDEDAFRRAQDEDAKRRIERIKEIKRGLKNWDGWSLDLVDSRRGGGYGVGEVFEI